MVFSTFPALSHNKLTFTNTIFKFCLVLFLTKEFLTRTFCFAPELKRHNKKWGKEDPGLTLRD